MADVAISVKVKPSSEENSMISFMQQRACYENILFSQYVRKLTIYKYTKRNSKMYQK